MFEVISYVTNEGRNVFKEWLFKLRDGRTRKVIARRLSRIAQDNFGDHKPCRDGVWELRIDFGPGYRIYYAISGVRVVLLLCGGDKSTQTSDINRACEYWKEYQGR